MPTALVFLAEGAEEMETVITVDVLRRAGIDVTLAGLSGEGPVKCSRAVKVIPDAGLEQALKKDPYDALILPGGAGGAKKLAECGMVGVALKEQEKDGRLVAAVCAAPIALVAHGIGAAKKVTSHPSVAEKMKMEGYSYSTDRVVVDGNLITSQGPGTCFEFALKIVEHLLSKDKAHSLVEPMLIKM
ncbi:Parkinson disease protein 7 homolog [Babylonia areolata]|uniref:Parkinson disease protein 7 homolog n=1 Tax=Babylonia areolata TaxID=304850 RepID=UPI003FD4820A